MQEAYDTNGTITVINTVLNHRFGIYRSDWQKDVWRGN